MEMLQLTLVIFAATALGVWALMPTSSTSTLQSGDTQLVGASPNPAAWISALFDWANRRSRKNDVTDLPLLRPNAQQASSKKGGLSAIYRQFSKMAKLSSQRAEELAGHLSFVGWTLTPQEFMGFKLFSTALWGGVVFLFFNQMVAKFPMILILALGMGFILPDMSLRSQVGKRHKAILRMLPEVVDLLSLCMGAGLDFLGALIRVISVKGGYEGKKKEPLLEELSVVIQEIKLGKRRSEALRAMAKRVNLQELSSFVRMLVQADRMGTPIAEVLLANTEDIRFERYNRAEKAALQAPLKILVPLIFCILPCVAIIVAAPIFLQFMRQGPLIKM